MAFTNPFRRKAPAADVAPAVNASIENPLTPLSDAALWLSYGGNVQRYGETVTELSAMANSTVNRCCAILAGLMASLPLKVYQDDPELGRIESPDHRLADLFNVAPHPKRGFTAHSWKEFIANNLLLHGNSYSVIRYDNAARIVALDYVNNPLTVETRVNATGSNVYSVTWPSGKKELIEQSSMLHFAGSSIDGVQGLARIRYCARDSIALARSIQTTTGAAFDNAMKPSTLIKVPRDIAADAMKRVAAFFSGEHGGQLNAGKPLFVQSDMDVQPFSVPMADLLAIEAAKYSVAEIARFFGVPLILLNENSGTTAFGAGISELVRGLLRFTLDAELCRVEAEINRKIFGNSAFYVLFDRDALLATDPKTQAETQATEIQSGTLSINEARQRRHRGKVPGGDTVLINSASIPLERALQAPAPAQPTDPQTSEPADPSQPDTGENQNDNN